MSELDEFQREMGAWAIETFPKTTHDSRFRHLLKELIEWDDADTPYERTREAVSIVFLLLHAAEVDGQSLWAHMNEQLQVVRARTYNSVNRHGVVEHDRTQPDIVPERPIGVYPIGKPWWEDETIREEFLATYPGVSFEGGVPTLNLEEANRGEPQG